MTRAPSMLGDAYVRGTADDEVCQRLMLERRGLGADGDVGLLSSPNMGRLLRSGRYPRFAGLVQAGLAPADTEAEFDLGLGLGLDAILDGLAARFGI